MQADVLALSAKNVPIFSLCYEDLAEKPEPVLRAICDFLELPFAPQMLELDHADCSMFPPGEHHAKVRSGHLTRSDRSLDVALNSIQREVPRYMSRWKARFGDRLASKRYWPQAPEVQPSSLELLQNKCMYAFSAVLLRAVYAFCLRLIPVGNAAALSHLAGARTLLRRVPALPAALWIRPIPSRFPSITPSYKQLPWLKLCAASVADQKGVSVEHIIQDAQSGPELEEWVRENTKAQLFVECDSGMYDAINRGVRARHRRHRLLAEQRRAVFGRHPGQGRPLLRNPPRN